MNTAEQKAWQLIAIHRLSGRGRKNYFGNKEISNELRNMPGLSSDNAEAIIRNAGYRRHSLVEDDKQLKRTTKQGKGAWGLTPKGEERISDILQGKTQSTFGNGFAKVVFDMLPDDEKKAAKNRAIETLEEVGIDSQAIWVLEQKKLTGAELARLLARQGNTATTTFDPEQAPRDNLKVEEQAIDFIIDHDERKWRRAKKLNQKGYDLEERDGEGNVVTWCEVKAISGPFELSQGVALSDAQFQMAMNKRDAYWLYIVENVGDAEKTRVLAIRNPASLVKRFVFRDSWRFAATVVIEA